MYFATQTLKPGYGSGSAKTVLQLRHFVLKAIRPRV